MIKIAAIEFIPRLGNGRPENGTGTFVSLHFMKTRLLQAVLALASGG
jgi:hypothetical protein